MDLLYDLCGWITSRGKNEAASFLTGGGNLGFFLIFCTVVQP